MADEQTTVDEPPVETEAPVEEEQLSPEEQAEVDAWLAGERTKWEAEVKEQLRAEIRGELEGEMDMKEFVEEVKAMKAELDELKGRQPKQRLSEDKHGARGPSQPPGKSMRVTTAQLNDLSWMAAHQGEIAKASATGDFEIVDD
jgi:hypothetical protein